MELITYGTLYMEFLIYETYNVYGPYNIWNFNL